jgi:tetratricopeptide (TPR) repeat protein
LAEPAHLLRIQAALAQNDPGLAVIYSQQYLFYYPGSVQGYILLGDARVREGNTDLALAAYDQALQGEDTNPFLIDALIARADIYNEQRRYDLAREDLTRALQLSDDNPTLTADDVLQIQAARMQAAYDARNFATAQEDADDLLGSGVLADAEIQLLQARILVDEASGDGDYSDALDILTTIGNALPGDLQPIADEYRARAHFNLGQNGDALNAIDRALADGETGSRHYLRGQILEEMDEPEEALREYEWVLTWGEVYPYSFLPDAQARVEALREE